MHPAIRATDRARRVMRLDGRWARGASGRETTRPVRLPSSTDVPSVKIERSIILVPNK